MEQQRISVAATVTCTARSSDPPTERKRRIDSLGGDCLSDGNRILRAAALACAGQQVWRRRPLPSKGPGIQLCPTI